MNQDDQRKLAIERGFLRPLKWLHDYTAAVEAPLQARIAQLEEALLLADEFITNGVALKFIRMPDVDCPDPAKKVPSIVRNALTQSPSTWLSEHDKEVAAKERERCSVVCDTFKRGFIDLVNVRELQRAIRELK